MVRLEVHQNGMQHVAASNCFAEVHFDAYNLQDRIAVIRTFWLYTVFIADLGSNLIPSLTALDVDHMQTTNMLLSLLLSLLLLSLVVVLLWV